MQCVLKERAIIWHGHRVISCEVARKDPDTFLCLYRAKQDNSSDANEAQD